MMALYQYRASLVRVVDADTLVLDIDQGLETTRRITVRLALVDAVERSHEASPSAINFVREWMIDNEDEKGYIRISTIKDKREKYGRYLVLLHGKDPASLDLNHVLVTKQFATYTNWR
jgi:micrococcal nuclease